MNKGFVIGNGESRKGFNLKLLKGKGHIYGCNALYREFKPDILFVHDTRMLKEVSELYKGIFAYADGGQVRVFEDDVKTPSKILSLTTGILMTGVCAAYFMCKQHDVSEVFLLGFDPFKNGDYRSCIYDGTHNYPERKATKDEIPSISRSNRDMNQLLKHFPDKRFYRVGDRVDLIPNIWTQHRNLFFIDYRKFKEKCGITI